MEDETTAFSTPQPQNQSFGAMLNVEESQYQYDNLVIRTGCVDEEDTLACLRSLSATFLQENNYNTPSPGAQVAPLFMYGPVIDNDFVQNYTYGAFEQGRFVRLPAIFGDDTNEGTIFTPKNTSTIGQSDTFLQSQFPALTFEQLRTINSLYPVAEQYPDSGKYWRQVSNAYGEQRYICPGIFISNVYAHDGVSRNWNYRWNVIDRAYAAAGYGVTHVVEVGAIWGPENANGFAPASYSTTNAAIVPVVQAYWTSFIRSFDPNTFRLPGTPEWGAWTPDGYQRLMFQTNATAMETVPEDQKERCAYLTSIGVAIKQ